MPYAEHTSVPIERSKAEIEQVLRRNGCDAFMSAVDDRERRAMLQFRAQDRLLRFEIVMPNEEQFGRTESRRRMRSPEQRRKAYEQAERQRWRALLLVVKAKLESVESGVETFEQAFMPHIVLPDNSTVGQRMLPAVAQAYETGQMPQMDRLLPAAGEAS